MSVVLDLAHIVWHTPILHIPVVCDPVEVLPAGDPLPLAVGKWYWGA